MISLRTASLVPQAILVALLASVIVRSQEMGGGSTENFKRPSNPPVHHRSQQIDASAGGRIPETTGVKQSTRNSQTRNTETTAGTQPGTSVPARSESTPASATNTKGQAPTPPAKTRRGAFGNLKSPRPIASPTPSPSPPLRIVATPVRGEINEDLEAAIETGNAARDQKPPDYVEAERAYQLAAKLGPTEPRPYEGLGNIYLEQRRDTDAIVAYRKAVELKTENAEVFEGMGDAYFRLGRFAESIAASTEAMRLNPETPGPYFTRTHVNLTLGRAEAAAADARAFLERWRPHWAGGPPYYVAIAGYLGYREAGQNAEAAKLLAEMSKDCQDINWVCRLVKYLRQDITAEQLLSEADNNDKLTEAHTYIGVVLALAGRSADALPHFRWVQENGNRRFTEYQLSAAWIAKIEQK